MTLRHFALLYSIILMLILIMVLLGYRQFVALPKIEQAITAFQERELSTLKLALDKEVSFLKVINYDYSVWTDAYQFVQSGGSEFVDDNFVDDTFTSLKIDGVYIFDDNYQQLWGKGFDYDQQQAFSLPEMNLSEIVAHRKLFPAMHAGDQVPQNAGFLNTLEGPIMFASTQVRNSNRSGEVIGVIVFVKKIRPGLIESLSQMSQLGLSFQKLPKVKETVSAKPLKGSLQGETFSGKRQRVITDINNNALILLNINHSQFESPDLFDSRTLMTLLLLTTIPMAILLFVNIYLVEPVARSTKVINKMIQNNQLKSLSGYSNITEIDELIGDFNHLIHRIIKQQTELEQLTLLDGLTSIANRRAFEEYLTKSWASMLRSKLPMAVMMCDIDYFKRYNDSEGHQGGDETLKKVALALQQRISRPTDLVARYGGEEFVIVLGDTSVEKMITVIEIVLQTVRDLNITHADSPIADIVTISVGAAIFEDGSRAVEYHQDDLVKAADQALYRAKETGRNRGEYTLIAKELIK